MPFESYRARRNYFFIEEIKQYLASVSAIQDLWEWWSRFSIVHRFESLLKNKVRIEVSLQLKALTENVQDKDRKKREMDDVSTEKQEIWGIPDTLLL